MAYKVERVDVWIGTMADKAGALAQRLTPLAEAGVNLEFVLARRDKPRKGVVFMAPIKGAAQAAAAKKAGIAKTDELVCVRVAGPDTSGLGAGMMSALGEAGINVRGLSAMAVGRKSVCYVALDTKADATKARRLLAKVLK